MRKRSKLKIYEYQDAFKKYYEEGWSIRKISRYLGRSPSTISRLFKRDIHPCPGIWRHMTSYEKAMYSWEKSRKRASKCRKRLRLKNKRIRKVVSFILKRWEWSPEAISDFLKLHGLIISAKAIYRFVKKERAYLIENLYFKGKARRQRVSRPRSVFKTGAPAKKSIHERAEINNPGHWEVDTIHSKRGSKSGVLTLRELETRQTSYFIVADLTSKSIMRVLFPFFQNLPPHMRRTLTTDNGSEFSELYKLEKILPDFGVYYCDAYKSYQKGSVENANRELRRFFPKKTDFSKVSEKELRAAEYKINGKPMKVLNGQSAAKTFRKALKAA